MKLIYIGDHFYMESGTMISPIYTEDGYRSDWGHVQTALRRGDSIEIRQATPQEREFYETRLTEMKREADDRVARGVTQRHNVEVQGQDEAQLRTVPLERPVGGESQSQQHGEKG